MKRSVWLVVFLFVLGADIACIAWKQEIAGQVFKPLIVPVLVIYFLTSTKGFASSLSKWMLAALFFSWVGDVLLMFEDKNELFFLFGLSSFLIAHIFYIIFFHSIRKKENINGNLWLLLPVVVYYVALISWLSPYLGDKKLPVRVYGLVISFMLMLALHMIYINYRKAGQWMVAGALLFISSDTLLAINKFYGSFEWAGIVVILTYGLAQLFISRGAAQYIRAANTR